MIILRKHFSGVKILETSGSPGFIRGRKYDTDLDRLGRMETSQRELNEVGTLGKEMRKLNKELNQGRLGKWQDIN
jgi:hypothetical protein